MSKYCTPISIFLAFVMILPLQAQVLDDFSDGDFSANPEWIGNTDLFTVAPYDLDPDNLMLRSNSPGAATYYLSTVNNLLEETSWEFFINLRFATSGVNYADVYLVADDANLLNAQNAYFIRFGRVTDDITFWKRVAGNETLLIEGPAGQVGSSSNNPFFVKTTRDENGFWVISVDSDAGGNPVILGSINDADITATEAFGIAIVQSAASSPVNSHWFDDVEIAIILPDTIPPVLVAAEATDANQVAVHFSEPLDETSAVEVSHYNLAPGLGQPASAVLDGGAGTSVTLTFADEMVSGTNYQLSVNGVEDLSGNAMDVETVTFLYVVPEIAVYKDVVFNEIMADPTPVVSNLPEEEYLELYNASDKHIQLQNWVLVNTTTERTLSEYQLEPGGFVILCHQNHVSQFELYGPVIGIPSFVALANAADSLTLKNPSGEIIDIVSYTTAWYGDSNKTDGGWSLELINPDTPCSDIQNWAASVHPSGGTPGAQNSVYDTTPDTEPPYLVNYAITGTQSLVLGFSEDLAEESVADAQISIEPEMGVSTVSLNAANELLLELEAAIDTAVTYTVTVNGVTDCVGNTISDNNSITFIIGYQPGKWEVLFNEILPDPTPVVGLPAHEFIELYNPTEKLFDLSGSAISGVVLPANTHIQPLGYLVLVSSGAAVDFDWPVVETGMSSTFLTNSGRELVLVGTDGTIIDRMVYDLSWYHDPAKTDGGWSIERINPEEPCRAGDNWRASVAVAGGTPGAQNSVYDTTPDQIGPKLNSILVLDSVTIELVFNEVLDSDMVISAGYAFEPELTVFDIQLVSPDNKRVVLTFAETLQPNQVHTINIYGLTDCSGNEYENTDDAIFGRPGAITAGRLIINEVLFNQRTGGADFVEIYNHSDAIVSLSGWVLANYSNNQLRLITDEPFILLPGEYLAVTNNKANILAEYPFAPESGVFEAESIPTYNNSDGQVGLIDPQGEEVDRFDYNEKMHFALLDVVKGVSLERISFDRPSDDPTNWISASEQFNWATPGFENSQFQLPVEQDGEVTVYPEIFSPDNDGYQDVLTLSYRFDRSGLTGNITIYDSNGREIRRLMRNGFVGTEGQISWDGLTDNGERTRMGIHIIYFEVFSADGYTHGYKRSCVVSSRF